MPWNGQLWPSVTATAARIGAQRRPTWPQLRRSGRDVIAAILEQVIADGKGIELNTSSFRYGLPDLQPCTEILRLYLDLGGSVLTLGSDSHEPAHLAAHIGEVRERLRGVGYEHFCTFERFEPVWHEL